MHRKTQLFGVLLAAMLLLGGAFIAAAQGGDTTAIVLGGDEDGLRAMLARTGASYGPGYNRSIVHVASLPDEMPFPLPMPDGASIIGSIAEHLADDQPSLARIYINSDLDPQTVTDFYVDALESPDWREFSTFQGAGFVDAASVGISYYYQDAQMLNIDSHQLSDGTTDTQLLIQFEALNPVCAQQAEGNGDLETAMQQVFALIPQLETPDGIRLLPGGGGGGGGGGIPGARTSSVSSYLESEIPLAEVLQGYNTQLAEAGWTLVNMESGEFSAWSGWTVTDDNGNLWDGTLTVNVLPSNPQVYHATVIVREAID